MFDHGGPFVRKPKNDLMSLAENASRPLPVLTRLVVMLQVVFAKLASLLRADRASGELPVALVEESSGVTQETVDQPVDNIAGEASGVTGEAVDQPVSTFADESSGVAQETADQPVGTVAGEALGITQAAVDQSVSTFADESSGVTQEMVDQPVGTFLGEVPGVAQEMVDQPVSTFVDESSGVAQDTADQPVASLELTEEIVVAEPVAIAEPKEGDRSERENLIRRRWQETGIKMWNPDGAGHAALNIQGRAGLLPVKPGERLPGYDTLAFKLIDGQIVCEDVVVDPPKRRK
jgi:hypothetical protein